MLEERVIIELEYDIEDLHNAQRMLDLGYPNIDIDVLANKIYKRRIENETILQRENGCRTNRCTRVGV